MSNLNPYINLKGNAREAMGFYESVFGGEATFSTFGEFGMSEDPADKDKIMHSQLVTTSGFTLMVSDAPESMQVPDGSNIQISISGGADEEPELRGYYDKLSGSGSVTVPLEKAPWGDYFGMCQDKYGVDWMVNVAGS